MKNKESENYLDQLLNSMNYEDDNARLYTPEPVESDPMDSFVRDLFGESGAQTGMKAKDEEEFLREFEQDLLKDDIPHFVNTLSEDVDTSALKTPTMDESIDDMINHMNSYSGVDEDFDAVLDENAEYEGEMPEEPKMVVPSEEELEQAAAIKHLDQAVDAFDGEMETNMPAETDGLAELPVTEDGEIDLSGMGGSDLMDMLAQDSGLSDLGDMLSPDGGSTVMESSNEIGNFAESELEARMNEVEAGAADTADGEKKKKSGSFFSRLSKLFFGDDEDEAEKPIDLTVADGMSVSQLSDENQQILRELEAAGEGVPEAQGKKSKKEKKLKKEKKKKEPKPKKEKAPKPPKPKKVKKPKEIDHTPPLPKKPVIAITVMVASLFGLVLLGVNLLGYQAAISQAKDLYKHESYVEAYSQLSGFEIKEKDMALYNRLATLAPVSSEYNTYLIFSKSGRNDMALDALVCAYGRYDENKSSAQEYQCMAEFENIGGKIIRQLLEEYDMTGEEALAMYNASSRKQYTLLMHEKLQALGLE